MASTSGNPVVTHVRYFLAHTPGLVRYGSKPSREIPKDPAYLKQIASHLRSYQEAVAYPPNRVFLGSLYPDDLRGIARPWYQNNGAGQRLQPHGDIMPEEEFYGVMKICDAFDLMWLEEGFLKETRSALERNPFIAKSDLGRLGEGRPFSVIEAQSSDPQKALPLYLRDGRLIGCFNRAHEEDGSLAADVLMENLACKATGVMAMRHLFRDSGIDPSRVDYVINSGEEAVGDRYQRGGGNLAKAMAEMCGCENATGSDTKAFCCGPNHAMVLAGSLVTSGVFQKVMVVGGCSVAKLGMKFLGHLKNAMPILEDVLAGVAIMVQGDDGVSPVLRLDSVGRHTVSAGSAQQAIFEKLVVDPLKRLGLRFQDIDKYATELHNSEVTEPAGSGNVPQLNYRLIGGLAALHKEITPQQLAAFAEQHGMPGYSPTQGHIASAVPFMGHALDRIKAGQMRRAMFLAKGSLFLGRMTQQADGLSFILEKNPQAG